ncbi:SigE family RNA polymerase sigma factor [Enemella sp. A6]|uniref:SigE family RNA polymerase sigma factor n=1 Tax=Enemella sp. A6 TaxID=3440152 RepID=UPI003EB9B2EF
METTDFDDFVRATSGRLLGAARLLCGSVDRAEDLVQDAYARAYLKWDRIRDEEPYAYVRRIVINRNTDWWRGGWWREHPRDYIEDHPARTDFVSDLATRDSVYRSLRELTRRERAVIVLRYFEGASEKEIADILNVAVGTVKSTANRALTKMRRSTHLTLDIEEEADD